MKFDIYCDECFPDLLTSGNPQAQYVIIGSLWLPSEKRAVYKTAIHTLRDQHKVGGEIKSRKVSPSKLDFYKELIDFYVDQGTDLRFRAIAIDHSKVDIAGRNQNSAELSFYKFYYQMLHHWLGANNSYSIFCDYQTNQHPDRLTELKKILGNANPLAEFPVVQWVRSKESVLTQLSDVLTGLTSAKLNATTTVGSAKHELLTHFESRLERTIGPTGVTAQKFNLFQINLDGGW
ncbi:DUF3800 domain-containing protein [Rubritalea tangerina]|uniref:DUF3800 domain-containing protein n=1 Tax=Rubritalea tangerina TaxID=430798 RepID=A0ABW4ZDG3_9BACT